MNIFRSPNSYGFSGQSYMYWIGSSD